MTNVRTNTVYLYEVQKREGHDQQWEIVSRWDELSKARQAMQELDSEYPMYMYSIKCVKYTRGEEI